MKDRAIKENHHSFWDRMNAFCNNGKANSLTDEELSWHD